MWTGWEVKKKNRNEDIVWRVEVQREHREGIYGLQDMGTGSYDSLEKSRRERVV